MFPQVTGLIMHVVLRQRLSFKQTLMLAIEAPALLLDWPGARTSIMLNEISWLL